MTIFLSLYEKKIQLRGQKGLFQTYILYSISLMQDIFKFGTRDLNRFTENNFFFYILFNEKIIYFMTPTFPFLFCMQFQFKNAFS